MRFHRWPLLFCYVFSEQFPRVFSTVLSYCPFDTKIPFETGIPFDTRIPFDTGIPFDTKIPFCCCPRILSMNQLTEKQEARSELRSQFLLTLNAMKGRQVTLNLYGTRNPIKATFAGFDSKFRNFLVTDLHSCVGVVDSAVIRATDVVSINFQDGK